MKMKQNLAHFRCERNPPISLEDSCVCLCANYAIHWNTQARVRMQKIRRWNVTSILLVIIPFIILLLVFFYYRFFFPFTMPRAVNALWWYEFKKKRIWFEIALTFFTRWNEIKSRNWSSKTKRKKKKKRQKKKKEREKRKRKIVMMKNANEANIQ